VAHAGAGGGWPISSMSPGLGPSGPRPPPYIFRKSATRRPRPNRAPPAAAARAARCGMGTAGRPVLRKI